MNELTTFYEVQRFRTWWIALPLVVVDLLFLAAVVWQVVLDHPIGDHPAPNELFAIIAIIPVALSVLIFSMKLEVWVDREGIHYRYPPFISSTRHVKFNELKEVYVRKYRPMVEFGGWGLRLGLFGSGQALNVSGNIGLQLVFTNGRKLLLGTTRGEELQKHVDAMREQGSNS